MKVRSFAAAIAVALISMGGLASPAVATDEGAMCVPRAAVPYQPAVTETVHHDAVTEEVQHPAKTHTEYLWQSWDWGTWTFDYKWAVDDPGKWWDPSPSKRNQESREVVDEEAWTETVIIKEAYDETVVVTPEVPAQDAVTCEIGLFLYQKLDPNAPAGWTNSGPQQFIAVKDGVAPQDWFTEFPGQLPEGVCGPGWAVQQDAVRLVGDQTVNWGSLNIEYPSDGGLGWPPIYADRHVDLETLIDVPDCVTTVESSFEASSWSGNCYNPNGGFTYDVTVGTNEGDRKFRVKDLGDGTGGAAETYYYSDGTTGAPGEIVDFATVAAGESATLSLSDLPPGNYRVVSDGSQGVKAKFKYDFTIDEPSNCTVYVTPQEPTWADECGPDNGAWSFEDTDSYYYIETREGDVVTLTAHPRNGYGLEGTTSWSMAEDDTPCLPEPQTRTSQSSSLDCAKDVVSTTKIVESREATGWNPETEEFTWGEWATVSTVVETSAATDAQCPTEKGESLAHTGGEWINPTLAAGGLILAGSAVLFRRRWGKEDAQQVTGLKE